MAWIELHQSLLRHPKLIRLASTLCIKKQDALWLLISLWLWALDYASDGDLKGFGAYEIAEAAEWNGDKDALLSALQECRWMDKMKLHDWMDYAGRLIEKRAENKERMRARRAAHDQRTTSARPGATVPNQTNRTVPYQEDQDIAQDAFDEARKAFPGTKRGLSVEWLNFTKKHPGYREIVPLLLPAIRREEAHKRALTSAKQFCPGWKNFQTWLNQSCWTQEFPEVSNGSTGGRGGNPGPYQSAAEKREAANAEFLRDLEAGDHRGPNPADIHVGEAGAAGEGLGLLEA